MMKREHFSSRLGFILITAACSIGLGNIWRFPYITGKYGGASFVLLYMVFLVILGLPIVVMEFAVRAGQPEKHGPLLPCWSRRGQNGIGSSTPPSSGIIC